MSGICIYIYILDIFKFLKHFTYLGVAKKEANLGQDASSHRGSPRHSVARAVRTSRRSTEASAERTSASPLRGDLRQLAEHVAGYLDNDGKKVPNR